MIYFRPAVVAAAIIFTGAGAGLAQDAADPSGSGALKVSKEECQALWSKADSAQNENLTNAQASAYITNFKAVDTNGDGKISSSEFMTGCQRGLAHEASSSGAGAGTSGESGAPAKRE